MEEIIIDDAINDKDEETAIDDKAMTFEKKIEGKGTVRIYGTLDLDKFIHRLISSKSLTK